MSLHDDIISRFARHHEALAGASTIGPLALAEPVLREYNPTPLEPHVEYLSLEHLKHMARRFLAGIHGAEGEENPAHQGELFSGILQERYPIPRKTGEEPVYKRRCDLTAEERAWNVAQLRKSAYSRLAHADALEAEGNSMVAA